MLTSESHLTNRLLQPTDDRAVLYEQAQQILRRDGAERSTFTSSATVSLSVSLGQLETAKNEPVPSQSPHLRRSFRSQAFFVFFFAHRQFGLARSRASVDMADPNKRGQIATY